MSGRESGPRPEEHAEKPADKEKETKTAEAVKPVVSKPDAAPQPGHSPAEARLKSREQIIGPDGSVRTKMEYYEVVPEAMSATETARAKAAEGRATSVEAKVKAGDSSVEIAGKTEKESDDKEKKELKEKGKETSGHEIVEEVKNDLHAPKEVKEALKDPHKAKEAAKAVEEKSIFGDKTKNFFRRFGTGMAAVGAKAGIKFLAKRTLDFGTVGAGAVAGGVVGGAVEGIKAYRAETKRLYDLKTYKDALAGYEHMTNLDKVTAVIALEEKLKEKFEGRTLSSEEHSILSALKSDLRQKLQEAVGKDKVAGKKEETENLEKLLAFRSGQELVDDKTKEEV
jgi:hypothetical protein